jgi:hypothetical protein
MITATLIQTYIPSGPGEKTITPILLTESSVDEIYRIAFKKHINPASRCFTVNFHFEDPVHQKGYSDWVSNVSNYAMNGGNMD